MFGILGMNAFCPDGSELGCYPVVNFQRGAKEQGASAFPTKWGAKERPRVSQPHDRLPCVYIHVFCLLSDSWHTFGLIVGHESCVIVCPSSIGVE